MSNSLGRSWTRQSSGASVGARSWTRQRSELDGRGGLTPRRLVHQSGGCASALHGGCASALHGGFTLLETLLALGLSSFLLVVVFSLVDSTAHYHVSGNDQILASERMLGVLQDMRMDLRSVCKLIDVPPVDNSTPIDAEIDDKVTKLTQQLQLKELAAYAEPIALAGDSHWLLLTLQRSNPRLATAGNVYPLQQQVVWMVGDTNAAVIPTHDDHGRTLTASVPAMPVGSLWRVPLTKADSTAQSFGPARIAQVRSLNLRYFDGQAWSTNWNSAARKSLPKAVEVNLVSADATAEHWVIALTVTSSQVRSGGGKRS